MDAHVSRLRRFQVAWGEIISGDLNVIEEHLSSNFTPVFSRFVRGGLFEHVPDATDILPTLELLSDCTLSAGSHTDCFRVLSMLRGRGQAVRNEVDYLQQQFISTDPKIQEAAALELIYKLRHESSQARVVSARMSVTETFADLFCNFEMKSFSSKTTLSRLLHAIMSDFGQNCSIISQKVLSCALRVLRTASLDPDARAYAGYSLTAVGNILQLRSNMILDIDYMQIFDPHQFRSFFPFLMCFPKHIWDIINDGILTLPRKKLGDTDLTSLFLQPEVLDAIRHAFVAYTRDGSYCSRILDMWRGLVVLEPSAVIAMIRLDFLGDTILHMLSGDERGFECGRKASSFFREMILLMDKMLDVSMHGTVEYFFNRGFIKYLAAAIKLPTGFTGLSFVGLNYEPLHHVIRCFEIAAPPVCGSAAAVAFVAAETPSVELAGVIAVPTDTSERDMINGHPAWAYDLIYNQLVSPVPIDNLEAFAAVSGNTYIASFFVDLLAPTPGDKTLSHNEKWAWLIDPNPLCLAVMRHLLHDKPATKKALFAAAGIHELSRNARDFGPRPHGPFQSHYRDADGNDVCI